MTRFEANPVTLEAAYKHLAALSCYDSGELVGSELFLVTVEGVEVGVYAISIQGQAGWILAGAGHLANSDLTVELLPLICEQLKQRGATVAYLRTARHGLVKKLDGSIFALDSVILKAAL